MNRQRWVISTPGQSVSTMNAVTCGISLPFFIFGGVRAITTSSSAIVPFVHQSFSPLMMNASPSSVGTAVVVSAAGSLPTGFLGEREGRHRAGRESREILLLLLGGPEELEGLRNADRLVSGKQSGEIAVLAGDHLDRPPVSDLRQPETAVFRGDLDAERAQLFQALNDVGGQLAGSVDLFRVDVFFEERHAIAPRMHRSAPDPLPTVEDTDE